MKNFVITKLEILYKLIYKNETFRLKKNKFGIKICKSEKLVIKIRQTIKIILAQRFVKSIFTNANKIYFQNYDK